MSEQEAKKFIEQLGNDNSLRIRLLDFIRKEGFSCSLEDIKQVQWQNLVEDHYSSPLPGTESSKHLPASEHWG